MFTSPWIRRCIILPLMALGSGLAIASDAKKADISNLQTQIIGNANIALPTQQPGAKNMIPPPPSIDAKGYVLIDANSGRVLAGKNISERMPPASLTKLMTMYVVSQALAQGQANLNDDVRISKLAWSKGGSKMFIKVGDHIKLQELIKGIIVASGNDACVAVAEFVAGNEDSFSQLMNMTAKQLGMENTNFTDSTGLPAPNHYTTPLDMAILARHVVQDFPQDYKWYKEKWIMFNNIKQPNRNRLLWRDSTVDGMKTGHTEEAGYCLVSSAKRNGTRLIAVVMGAPSDEARSADSMALYNWGFRFFKTMKVYDSNKELAKERVYLGTKKEISLGLQKPLYVTVPIGKSSGLKASIEMQKKVKAPVKAGTVFGKVVVTAEGKEVGTAPLVALEEDNLGGFWTRFVDRLGLIVTFNWF